jgi:RNA polymerase sigma factor (sigma-70 family)|nr:sigma-70 family RNA polymerase sigma factor [Kofleriaceae bacterium]
MAARVDYLRMTSIPDADLVARCRRHRDAAAFGALVERHQPLVFGVALARCHDAALAEDLAQDAFVTAWRDLPRLRDVDRIGPWIAGIARNLAATAVRDRTRRAALLASADPDAAAPGAAETPEDAAITRQDRALLAAAMGDVPDAHRDALVRYYLDGEPVARIASALGVTQELVKQRLSRGRRALRDSVVARVAGATAVTAAATAIGTARDASAATAMSTPHAVAMTAGKVLVMTTTKLAIGVVVIAAVGAAAWLGLRAGGDDGAAGRAAPARAHGAEQGSDLAPAPAAGARRLDPRARDALAGAIRSARDHRDHRELPAAAVGEPTGPRPSLPADGELDKTYIRASVREMIPLLSECYEEGLDRDPTMAGSVAVDFTIEGEPDVGAVIGDSQIDASSSTLGDATVRECIAQTMYGLAIDPPANGGVVHVHYPFTFAPATPP